MGSCASCGIWVPDGQQNCSMCYGDPFHGRDGYYLAFLEQAALEQGAREEAARQQPAPDQAQNTEERNP